MTKLSPEFASAALKPPAKPHPFADIVESLPPYVESSPPYGEMCRDPKLCAGKGYCPRDPTCGD